MKVTSKIVTIHLFFKREIHISSSFFGLEKIKEKWNFSPDQRKKHLYTHCEQECEPDPNVSQNSYIEKTSDVNVLVCDLNRNPTRLRILGLKIIHKLYIPKRFQKYVRG